MTRARPRSVKMFGLYRIGRSRMRRPRPSRAADGSGDDDYRVVVVPLQGLRDRAEDVVVSVLGPADDDERLS